MENKKETIYIPGLRTFTGLPCTEEENRKFYNEKLLEVEMKHKEELIKYYRKSMLNKERTILGI